VAIQKEVDQVLTDHRQSSSRYSQRGDRGDDGSGGGVEFGAFIQMVARQDLLRLKLEPDQAGRLENLASKLEAGAMEEGFAYPATRREAWRRRAQAVTRGEAQLMVLLEEFCRAGARDAGSLARIVSRVLGSPLPLEKLTERISSLLPPRPPARELEAASSSASSELPGEPGVLTFLSFAIPSVDETRESFCVAKSDGYVMPTRWSTRLAHQLVHL